MMTNPGDSNPEKPTKLPSPVSPQQQPAPIDVESGNAAATADTSGGNGVVSNILRRWKREDLLKKAAFYFRGCGFICSFLAFIVMVTNKHGDWRNFDNYEEYRYVVGISILSTLYTGLHLYRQINELATGRHVVSSSYWPVADFFCDQVITYLLLSAASSAAPLTNRIREGNDNLFTDAAVTSICMMFFAFFVMALSALLSGYKLTNQSYV